MSAGFSISPLLVFGALLGFVGFVVRLGAKESRRTWERVQRFAAARGLEMEAPAITLGMFWAFPRASGILRGRRVEVFNYSTGGGKSRRTWSVFSARTLAAPGGRTFKLQPQNFGTRLNEFFGAREITIGNREFDDAWFVQTNEPEFFFAALLPDVQAKLLTARRVGANGTFEFNAGVLKYTESGTFSEERILRFSNITDLVGDLADIAEVVGSR